MKGIGEQVRIARVFKNLTQKEVQDATGISRNHLSGIESGKSPSLELIQKLSNYFNETFTIEIKPQEKK